MFTVLYLDAAGAIVARANLQVATAAEVFAIARARAARRGEINSFQIWSDGRRLIAAPAESRDAHANAAAAGER